MVAKSLENILETDIVSVAMDKSQPIDLVLDEVMDAWKVDLDRRNPAPAYKENEEGFEVYVGTDFDLFSFLNALADRNAVINIPEYKNMSPKTQSSDERIISEENRHGQILGLIANKKALSFNVRIKDYQVVQTLDNGKEEVGAPRNFALIDYDGKTREEWNEIEFKLNEEENDFLNNKKLWNENTLYFENFVHPNLAFSFYGSRYISTKILSMRVEDEAKHYRKIAKDLRKDGVVLKEDILKPNINYYRDKKDVEKVKVENLEAIVVVPDFKNEYPVFGMDEEGEVKRYEKIPSNKEARERTLRFSEYRAKKLSYSINPKLVAQYRAVELAYFLNGFSDERKYGNEKEPGWDIPEWKREYKLSPRARNTYNALELNEDVALVYRLHDVTVNKAS